MRDLERLCTAYRDLDLIVLPQDACQHVDILWSIVDDQNWLVARR